MSRPNPARLKVRETILRLLEKSATLRLPSVREISRMCGVSSATAWKEIKHLESQGLLVTKWGHHTIPADLKTEDKPANKTEWPKWESVRDRILEDIKSGLYPPGTQLPSRKQLQSRLSVSFQTITKSLQALVTTGVIEPKGNSFRVLFRTPKRKWRPRIVVVGSGNRPGTPKIESERERDFYHFLTVEAQTAQVDIEFVVYDDWSEHPCFYCSRKGKTAFLPEDDDVLGYIVSSWHIKNLSTCLHSIYTSDKPVSVWMENPSGYDGIRKNGCTYFNIGYSPTPGIQMGDYLLRLGHCEIAYISPFHGSTWSKDRLLGLAKSFSRAGRKYKVHPFTPGEAASEWSFTDEIVESAQPGELLITDRLENSLPPQFDIRYERFRSEEIKLLRDRNIFQVIRPAVDGIIKNRNITAIVASNDLCALLILDYLNWLGIPVPSRLSVAGFDDSFQGLTQGLTSYSFNTRFLVKEMLVNASTDVLTNSKESEIRFFEGGVVERSTTGRAEYSD